MRAETEPSCMPFFRALLRLAVSVFLATGACAFPVRAEPLSFAMERMMLPVTVDGSAYKLETFLVHPDDGARHPLVIISHGSPRDAADRGGMSPMSSIPQMLWFLRRGWTVAAPMRRGYGRSDGGFAEDHGSCKNPDYFDAGKAGAADLAASIAALSQNPHVDASRVLAVGVSAGAYDSVALTVHPPPGLLAAVAFAPGRGSRGPDNVCAEDRLVDAMGKYGATSRLPLFWVASANDHYFGPRLVKDMVAAFTGAGDQATVFAAPAFGEDGHHLFGGSGGDAIWGPEVDAFLAAHKLALVPTPADLAIPAVPDPPGIAANNHEAWVRYLVAPPHKAFAASGDGHHYGLSGGQDDIDGAKTRALGNCKGDCKIVSLDGAPEQ